MMNESRLRLRSLFSIPASCSKHLHHLRSRKRLSLSPLPSSLLTAAGQMLLQELPQVAAG